MEPETFEAPQFVEVLRKVEEKVVVAEKPNVEAAPAAKPEDETKLPSEGVDSEKQAEKVDVKVAEVETPSKKRKELPRLVEFLPQMPGPLGPIQTVAVAPAVDPKDF